MSNPLIEERLKKAEQDLEQLGSKVKKDPRTPKASDVFGLPAARKGEDPLNTRGRGFSFCKMFRAIAGAGRSNGLGDPWDHAKVEREVVRLMGEAFKKGGSSIQYEDGAVLGPFGTDLLPDQMRDDPDFGRKIKGLVLAGTADADPQEMAWLAAKAYGVKTNQSYLDMTLGGSLVGPPEQGELIDLFRNAEALSQLGVRTIGLPPSGAISFPRQTSATTGYWVGENSAITGSNVGTGYLALRGRKCGALLTMPNELLRYATPSAEALFRMDMAKTLALTMDLALLEGPGTDVRPRGLINTGSIETVTPTTVATDGNTLAEQDVYSFISQIEENNAQFEGFLMRPSMYYALLKRRNDAVIAADKKGAFTFAPFRALGDAVNNKNINGYRTVTSPQVSNTRVKGAGTTLTYILAGMWSDYIQALFGAVEFAAATQGDTVFAADQTTIRAILIGDGGARHPGAFALADTLVVA